MLFEKKTHNELSCEICGIKFPHPLGLAVGSEPDCIRYNSYSNPSFVEVGPLYSKDLDVYEKHGFWDRVHKTKRYSHSLKEAIKHIHCNPPKTLICANIAPLPSLVSCDAISADLLNSFNFMYDFADMFVIDTYRQNNDRTSPLKSIEFLSESIDAILSMRICFDKYKPIFIRVSNDINRTNLKEMLGYMRYSGIDGIAVHGNVFVLDTVQDICSLTDGRFPVIAGGVIDTFEQASALLSAGASLLQVNNKLIKTLLSQL